MSCSGVIIYICITGLKNTVVGLDAIAPNNVTLINTRDVFCPTTELSSKSVHASSPKFPLNTYVSLNPVLSALFAEVLIRAFKI